MCFFFALSDPRAKSLNLPKICLIINNLTVRTAAAGRLPTTSNTGLCFRTHSSSWSLNLWHTLRRACLKFGVLLVTWFSYAPVRSLLVCLCHSWFLFGAVEFLAILFFYSFVVSLSFLVIVKWLLYDSKFMASVTLFFVEIWYGLSTMLVISSLLFYEIVGYSNRQLSAVVMIRSMALTNWNRNNEITTYN